jgi:hypothetical protein
LIKNKFFCCSFYKKTDSLRQIFAIWQFCAD